MSGPAARRAGLPGGAGERLEGVIAGLGPLVIGFSGGADSALLAHFATSVLGRSGAKCVTAVSPSLAPEELAACGELAAEWDLDWETVTTNELDDPLYVTNGPDRCYHCKAELMRALGPIAERAGASIALGVNLDDLADFRPGQEAAAAQGALFPLVLARLTKREVREVSRALGLRTADKPSAPCLASRVPHGTPVTLRVLGTVGRAESCLRSLGFEALRVRHYGETARVELPVEELARALDRREEIVAALKGAGYRYVTLDLEGLRSGNLNGGRL